MDELKENELNPLENGEKAADGENELNEELENIRDLFQQELDAAKDENDTTYESPTGEILIQSLEDMGMSFYSDDNSSDGETSHEDDIIDEEDLCQCCGEKRRNKERGEDYPYCEDCRTLMLKNPLNFIGVLVTILVFLVAGLSVGLMVSNINEYSSLIEAETNYEAKNLSSAAVGYIEYARAADSEGVFSRAAIKHLVDVMTRMGYYNYAKQYAEQFFNEEQLDLPWNNDLSEILAYCDELEATDTYINENIGEFIKTEEYDEAIKKIEKLIKDNEKGSEEGVTYNRIYLEYIKYILLDRNNSDQQELIDTLLAVKELDEKEFGGKNNWIYMSFLIRQYAKIGDIESAKKYFDLSMDVNKQDVNSYIYLADAYRFSLSKDSSKEDISAAASEITKLASDCEASYDSNFNYPSYYRIGAIADLLNGKAEDAFTKMDSYLNESGGNISPNDFNLYAICAVEAGKDEEYKQVKNYFESGGYSLSKSVSKLENGKTTVYDILIDKEGEI